jgi:signal transduction histidine kinase
MKETTVPGATAPGAAVRAPGSHLVPGAASAAGWQGSDSLSVPATGQPTSGSGGTAAITGPLEGDLEATSSRWQRHWQQGCRAHPHAYDAGLALLIFVLSAGGFFAGARMGVDPLPSAGVWIATAIGCLALLFRRRHPWPVLVVTAVCYLTVQTFTHDVPSIILAVVTALVTITLAGQRWGAIAAAVVITLTAMGIGTIRDAEYWSHPRPVAVAALCALAIALADAVRNRRAYVAAVEERARRAELSREEDGRRRVADERLRIARELHDVLAHHIAVINVQAGVAGHLLERKPEQARQALDHVRDAARSVLSEMQAVVSVLREPGSTAGDGSEPAQPAPGLAGVTSLVEEFRATGLTVQTVISGVPAPLPPAVDLVAYRVVQESLTNARKHAGETDVVLRFDYGSDALALGVVNSGTGDRSVRAGRAAGTTGGFGLLGMRERVASVGGDFDAQPLADGGFRVAVRLPVTSG